jgi:D-glycerate 3-kinase
MVNVESNVRQALDKLLPKIKQRHQDSSMPIILGISGLQGSGKSTWASTIVNILSSEHKLHTITISLDDLYKTHDDLVKQREKNPDNKLYRVRGQPGTHDQQLAADFFKKLKAYQGEGMLSIPSFDKSKFDGEGDRAPKEAWPTTSSKPDVVIFEGWCIGFRPLTEPEVENKYKLAVEGKMQLNTPSRHKLQHLCEMNDHLRQYCNDFMGPEHFDFFIHIDATDLRYVYVWRMEQEHKMIAEKGMGMEDEEIEAFVDGYMPSYELYLDGLRGGKLFEDSGRMLSVQLNLQRSIERIREF